MNDDAAIPEIATWEEMTDWLVTSLTDQPTGLIIDLGPSTYVVHKDEDPDDRDEVVCAQVHVLSHGVLMVRRSRTMLDRLRFDTTRWKTSSWPDSSSTAISKAAPTDGHVFTMDFGLAADACVSWFRDMRGSSVLGDVQCDYGYSATLPSKHSASGLSPLVGCAI